MAWRASSYWLLLPALFVASGSSGCGGGSEPITIPSFNASGAAAEAVKLCDANGNGAIEGAELLKCPSLQAALPRIDQDGNGQLTADEIRERIASYNSHGIGLTSLNCSVTFNGQPLAGAIVTLVPEEFLGSVISEATGTTDGMGFVSPRKAGSEYPAMQIGLYKIRVSTAAEGASETIPANYNTETTLGIEVAPDSPETERVFRLDLRG